MGKRSRHIAARQAVIREERKRKKKSQSPERNVISSDDTSVSTAPQMEVAKVSETSPADRVLQTKRDARYQYVVSDLKQIAYIISPLIILLIILAFVL